MADSSVLLLDVLRDIYKSHFTNEYIPISLQWGNNYWGVQMTWYRLHRWRQVMAWSSSYRLSTNWRSSMKFTLEENCIKYSVNTRFTIEWLHSLSAWHYLALLSTVRNIDDGWMFPSWNGFTARVRDDMCIRIDNNSYKMQIVN